MQAAHDDSLDIQEDGLANALQRLAELERELQACRGEIEDLRNRGYEDATLIADLRTQYAAAHENREHPQQPENDGVCHTVESLLLENASLRHTLAELRFIIIQIALEAHRTGA